MVFRHSQSLPHALQSRSSRKPTASTTSPITLPYPSSQQERREYSGTALGRSCRRPARGTPLVCALYRLYFGRYRAAYERAAPNPVAGCRYRRVPPQPTLIPFDSTPRFRLIQGRHFPPPPLGCDKVFLFAR